MNAGDVSYVPPYVPGSAASLAPSSPTSSSVGGISTQILAANSARTGLQVINLGPGIVNLAFGVDAVIGSGITLVPYGTFSMDSLSFTSYSVNAVSSSNSTVGIQEWQ